MNSGDRTSQATLGFLTVLTHEQLGLVGGFLVLNQAGRPLEFHCTAPIKPTRAQQILFGPTLEAYLYGEQIGQTLLAKCGTEPMAVCTDVESAMAVRDFVNLPIALVLAADRDAPVAPRAQGAGAWRLDAPERLRGAMQSFAIGRNRLAVSAARVSDQQVLAERLDGLANFDLVEPFARIREAVEEAHNGSRG